MVVAYTRRFKPGDVGPDVEAVGRALCRAGFGLKLSTFNALPKRSRRTWGWRKRRWLRAFKRKHGLPPDAIYGAGAHAALTPHFDARARELMGRYDTEKLVEPRQGWGSLDRSLWRLYSRAVGQYEMSDLGTYNPASRLPGGGVSDHAKGPPALAFDVGIDPDIGFLDREGRLFFLECTKDNRCGYAILGDKIWSRKRASEGIRPYTAGGHLNHVHVSGRSELYMRAAYRAVDLVERALA